MQLRSSVGRVRGLGAAAEHAVAEPGQLAAVLVEQPFEVGGGDGTHVHEG